MCTQIKLTLLFIHARITGLYSFVSAQASMFEWKLVKILFQNASFELYFIINRILNALVREALKYHKSVELIMVIYCRGALEDASGSSWRQKHSR